MEEDIEYDKSPSKRKDDYDDFVDKELGDYDYTDDGDDDFEEVKTDINEVMDINRSVKEIVTSSNPSFDEILRLGKIIDQPSIPKKTLLIDIEPIKTYSGIPEDLYRPRVNPYDSRFPIGSFVSYMSSERVQYMGITLDNERILLYDYDTIVRYPPLTYISEVEIPHIGNKVIYKDRAYDIASDEFGNEVEFESEKVFGFVKKFNDEGVYINYIDRSKLDIKYIAERNVNFSKTIFVSYENPTLYKERREPLPPLIKNIVIDPEDYYDLPISKDLRLFATDYVVQSIIKILSLKKTEQSSSIIEPKSDKERIVTWAYYFNREFSTWFKHTKRDIVIERANADIPKIEKVVQELRKDYTNISIPYEGLTYKEFYEKLESIPNPTLYEAFLKIKIGELAYAEKSAIQIFENQSFEGKENIDPVYREEMAKRHVRHQKREYEEDPMNKFISLTEEDLALQPSISEEIAPTEIIFEPEKISGDVTHESIDEIESLLEKEYLPVNIPIVERPIEDVPESLRKISIEKESIPKTEEKMFENLEYLESLETGKQPKPTASSTLESRDFQRALAEERLNKLMKEKSFEEQMIEHQEYSKNLEAEERPETIESEEVQREKAIEDELMRELEMLERIEETPKVEEKVPIEEPKVVKKPHKRPVRRRK